MHLRNRNSTPAGGFVFYYEAKSGEIIKVQAGSSIQSLAAAVRKEFQNNGMPVPDNIEQIVEHQICIRQPRPHEVCWNDGIGDKIHHDWIKPALAKTNRAIRAITGKESKVVMKISGCGGCGGTRVYQSGKNNLGRAGTLNRLLK